MRTISHFLLATSLVSFFLLLGCSNNDDMPCVTCGNQQGSYVYCRYSGSCSYISAYDCNRIGGTPYGNSNSCNNQGNGYISSSSSFRSSSSSIVIVSGMFKDDRDNRDYKWVKIGTQIWMAENLNYNAADSKCYNNETANCTTYGRLYNWATAMANSASSTANPSGVRGVCPPRWHLPSDAEWDVLMTAVGGSSTAARYLKATSGWYNNGNGQDTYGFSALPGGYGYSDGSFANVGNYGYWWSASEGSSYDAYYRYMYYNYEYVGYYNDDKSGLFSVRCVQD